MDELNGVYKELLAPVNVLHDTSDYLYPHESRCRCLEGKSKNII